MSKDYPLDIRGKAFLLRPDTPAEGMPRQPRPGEDDGQLSEPLRTYALESGLTKMKPPTWTSNSLKALEATEYANEQGRFMALHEALYRAFWEEGRDIGSEAVLQETAESAGLEWGPLKEALDTGRCRPAVMEQFQEALDMGFQGIPAFTMGGLAFTGAQPMKMFRAVADRAMNALQGGPDASREGRRSSWGLLLGDDAPKDQAKS